MDKPYNPVGWFELYVADMERARAFYSAVFQRELIPLEVPAEGGLPMEMYAFPWQDARGAPGALVKMDGLSPGPGGTLIYFSCMDVADECARAEAAGGTVVQPRMSIGQYGFIALIKDTEGNVIGLHAQQ